MAESDIRATMASVEKLAERVIKRVGFQVQTELVISTPVDTGWARANWLVSIGQPTNGPTPKSGEKGLGNADVSEREARAARLLVYDLKQGDVHISNHVPYIGKLNEGHSPQAPAGWVEDAIRRAMAIIASEVRT